MATQAAVMTPPTARAHTLVRDDVSLARRFVENGLAGFGLKSHYTSTA